MLTSIVGRATAAVEWQTFEGHRRAALTVEGRGANGFSAMAPAHTGVRFTNRLSEDRSLTNQIFLNGSGVAAGDVDGDGRCDLYFCGLDSANALYRNRGGWQFEEITAAAGVACADQASTGAAFADVDGDGDLDLLVNGIFRGTRLFLNDGRGRFREVTEAAGLRGSEGSASMALADVDGDGRLDLYVVNYRNDTMRDMPDIQFSVGVTNGVYRLLSVNGRSAASPEYEGRFTFDRGSGVLENGQADALFRNRGEARFVRESWTSGAFRDERGSPVSTPYDWGLSAMFRDLNGDGAPDLYVCNDFQSPDRVWINDGRGNFQALARGSLRQTSLFSMGVDFADLDRDGRDDFFVADMLSPDAARRQVQVMDARAFAQVRQAMGDRPQHSRNTLFLNRGNGTYAEIAQFGGVEASDWSWCPAFLDVDLDGYEDLLITTGHWRDAQHADIARELDQAKSARALSALEQLRMRRRFPRLDTPNVAFRNRGDLTFESVGAAWGFDSRRISQGLALADFDGDGDLDVAVNCLNDGPLLYRNEATPPRLAIRLRGLPPNTRGVGARLTVRVAGLPTQSQEMICGGRYLSSDDFVRAFAGGHATNRATIEVAWRSGRRTVIHDAPVNNVYEIQEPATPMPASIPPSDPAPASQPLFQDVSTLLNHTHHDEPFDDFARQPLLPRRLSQLGPGLAWLDFNSDGWDDLIIGTGRGGRLAVFRNDAKGGFIPQKAKLLEAPAERDFTSILGWRPSPTNLVLLVGLDNYEAAASNAAALRQFDLVTGAQSDELLRRRESTGPMAMADVDGDGDLDLFVGGRVIGGRYPEAASCALLRNVEGRLRFDPEASRALQDVGLVSSAVFTDLDGDSRPELVLACEWGPLKIFRFDRGQFAAWNPKVIERGTRNAERRTQNTERKTSEAKPETLNSQLSTLNELTGWWTAITAGDFDNDGRFDLIAGNWGRNSAQRRFKGAPVRLHFGEFESGGPLALVEAAFDLGTKSYLPVRDRDTLGTVFPPLFERYPTFVAFSQARAADVLASGLPAMREVSAALLDSILLLNRGDHFEVSPLPREAQLAPIFGLAVGDLDGDGNEDAFVAQNFFGVSTAESRLDAGCGLVLRGDGRGGFSAMSAAETGLAILGEGRGAALSDFDHDGRLDVVVAQNSGPTKLYRNARAQPGLRVRLQGPPSNPQAIGAVVRLEFPNHTSAPSHEWRLGGGYWSQDSGEAVLGTPVAPVALQLRWPDGRTERVPVPSGSRTLTRVY